MYNSANLTDQPSLTTSSGKIWLIAGGLLAFISCAVLFPMMWLEPPGVALVGHHRDRCRCTSRWSWCGSPSHRQRVRLAVLAFLMMAIAIAFFISAGIITATEWNF